MKVYIVEPKRKILIENEYQTAVVGGGIAGISAALAACRNGNKVVLIEKNYILGGLATSGLVSIYLPLCDGNGKQVSFGIAEELLRLSIKDGCEGSYCSCWLEDITTEGRNNTRFQVQFNPQIFAIRAEQLLLKSGVEIMYGSNVCQAVKKNNSVVSHLIVENKSGRHAIAVKNVIDATGDADICRLSGEKTVTFNQGNVLASWYYVVQNGKYRLNMLGFADIPDSMKSKEQIDDSKKVPRYLGIDANELTKMATASHKAILDDFLKKGIDSPEYALATIPTIPQVRMTRRIDGCYVMDDKEVHKYFSDSVGLFSDWRKKGPIYELPFSTLCGKTVSNLLVAGRIISVTDGMWDITRVIPVCAVSGEAAGTAASMTDDFSKIEILALQNKLKQNNIILHESDLQ